MNIHAQARTTKLIPAEIKPSGLSQRKLAEKYNSTVRKWKSRAKQDDRSHRPHNMHTT